MPVSLKRSAHEGWYSPLGVRGKCGKATYNNWHDTSLIYLSSNIFNPVRDAKSLTVNNSRNSNYGG